MDLIPGCEISEEKPILKIRFSNPPSSEEYIHCLDVVAEKYLVSGDYYYSLRMWVFAEGVNWSTKELQEVAAHVKSLDLSQSRVALVSSDDLGFGLARIYEVLREQQHIETMVCRSEDEAQKWLLEGDVPA